MGQKKNLSYYLARTEVPSDPDIISQCTFCDYENFVIQEDFMNFRRNSKSLDSSKSSYDSNEESDLLDGFIGEYTGNTILFSEDDRLLIIHTSCDQFHYYTEIPLKCDNLFVGIDPYSEEGRDYNYFEKIHSTSKEPKFKTKMVLGCEELVPKNGFVSSSEEIESFHQFKNLYLEPFSELSKI